VRAAASALVALCILFGAGEAHAKGCTEVSDVVGERRCSRYGSDWSIEHSLPLTFRFGLRWSELSPSGVSFDGVPEANQGQRYKGFSYDGGDLGVDRLRTWGFEGGFTVFIVGQLYLGAEGGFAFGSVHTRSFTAGYVSLSDDSGFDLSVLHGGLPVGYRIPLGRASIRGEMLFGGVVMSVSHRMSAVDIDAHEANASAARWLIEPRIAGDVWFTQHLSAGLYAGTNLLDFGARSLGISLTMHLRAFDGDMALW
jgi:hypothetical protein